MAQQLLLLLLWKEKGKKKVESLKPDQCGTKTDRWVTEIEHRYLRGSSLLALLFARYMEFDWHFKWTVFHDCNDEICYQEWCEDMSPQTSIMQIVKGATCHTVSGTLFQFYTWSLLNTIIASTACGSNYTTVICDSLSPYK